VKKFNQALLDKETPRLERQRGMWSFLTWSFFLANFLTATEILGGSAHAAIADGDHADTSHSDGGNSYSGGSQPDMQHLTLESLPPNPENHSAGPKVALNPMADGHNAGPDLVAVHVNIPVAQPNLEATAGNYGSYAGSPTSYDTTNNYYSSDSHDTTSTTINNYVDVDSHNVTTVIDNIVNPVVGVVEHATDVVAPVINIVDTTVQGATQVVTDAVDHVGQIASDALGIVTNVAGDVVGDVLQVAGGVTSSAGDVLGTVTHTVTDLVADSVGTVTPLVSDLTSTATSVADSTIHTVGDAVGNLITSGDIGDAGNNALSTVDHLTDATVSSLGDTLSLVHDVAAPASLDTLTSPVTSLLDHDGSPSSAIASDTGATSGVHDLLGSTLGSLGVSSSGSLSFSSDAPDTVASNDAGTSTSGYSQFNLAVSDASHDASTSVPVSTDTGGITTIIASAIGIGSHTTNSTSDSVDHASDQQPVHLPVIDDLHSHLHLGLLG
jgi:hypothetical protein